MLMRVMTLAGVITQSPVLPNELLQTAVRGIKKLSVYQQSSTHAVEQFLILNQWPQYFKILLYLIAEDELKAQRVLPSFQMYTFQKRFHAIVATLAIARCVRVPYMKCEHHSTLRLTFWLLTVERTPWPSYRHNKSVIKCSDLVVIQLTRQITRNNLKLI